MSLWFFLWMRLYYSYRTTVVVVLLLISLTNGQQDDIQQEQVLQQGQPQYPQEQVLLQQQQQQQQEQQQQRKVIQLEEIARSIPKWRYGVDCSFPVYNTTLRCYDVDHVEDFNHKRKYEASLFTSYRRKQYETYLDGCRKKYSSGRNKAKTKKKKKKKLRVHHLDCDSSENDRMKRNQEQPMYMKNYTMAGFKVISTPSLLFHELQNFYYESMQYNDNSQNHREHYREHYQVVQDEIWPVGSTIMNHWESPTYLIPINHPNSHHHVHEHNDSNNYSSTDRPKKMLDAVSKIRTATWHTLQNIMESWTGVEQKPVSMSGIRQYSQGAVISPHVTRLPLVCSCIIPIAISYSISTTNTTVDKRYYATKENDSSFSWILELYDRSRNVVHIALKPGNMLLIESSTIIHGRPFPLRFNSDKDFKDVRFAELYVHFEPTSKLLSSSTGANYHPPYLIHDSPMLTQTTLEEQIEEGHMQRRRTVTTKNNSSQRTSTTTTATGASLEAHWAASMGDIDSIHKLGKINPQLLHKRDTNGWQPIHEAVRGNALNVVQALIEQYNVNVNVRTYDLDDYAGGFTPTSLAIFLLGQHDTDTSHQHWDHPMILYLRSMGGKTEQELMQLNNNNNNLHPKNTNYELSSDPEL